MRTPSFADLSFVALFSLYIASQTEVVREVYAAVQPVLIAQMMACSFLAMGHIGKNQAAPVFLARSAALLPAALVDSLCFLPLSAVLAVVAKVIFTAACSCLFVTQRGRRALVASADGSLLTVALIAAAAKSGAIPSGIKYGTTDATFAEKYTAGFVSPNAAMFFVFSSLALYVVLGRKTRFAVGCTVALGLWSIGTISRTYSAGILMLYLLLVVERAQEQLLFNVGYGLLSLLAIAIGMTFFVVAATEPTALAGLIGTKVDELLSFRLEGSVLTLFKPGQTLTGLAVEQQDSVYYEAVFCCSPLLMLFVVRQTVSRLAVSRSRSSQDRWLGVLSVMSVVGMFEAATLTVTVCAVVWFAFALQDIENMQLN